MNCIGYNMHINELQANGVAERLCDLCHAERLVALNVGVDDRLAAGLARGALALRRQLQIDSHLFEPINLIG